MSDTIFALSSGRGKAGVAVVRVSGVGLCTLFNKITNRKSEPGLGGAQQRRIKNRYAYLVDLFDEQGGLIDKAIAIYFNAPNSFTGEDVIEFHVHGSSAVIEKLFATLRAHGARIAEPGEFTRRAFDNGKMDLVTADGLCALLDARTDCQRAVALKSMGGGDSAVYVKWRDDMIQISAYAAAILDYDASDLPRNIKKDLIERVHKLQSEISDVISRSAASRAIRSGFNIAIVGPVNAGKSSLFNRLVGESRAIVSDIPGTTRDVVSADIDLDGYLVRISDTAGLRETNDTVEKIGIERTNAEIENADLVIRVVTRDAKRETRDARCETRKENDIIVVNKSDLIDNCARSFANCTPVSALTGDGIPELLDLIKRRVHEMLDDAESDVAVNERTKAHLIAARDELAKCKAQSANMDIFSEHVRIAADEIGQILGVIGADEIMDAVFGQLCLGK